MKKVLAENECMHLSIWMLRILGCWPQWNKRHQRREQLYFVYAFLCYSMAVCYSVLLIVGMKVYHSSWFSWEDMVEEVVKTAAGVMMAIKMFIFFCNQPRLEYIVNHINNDLNEKELQEESDKRIVRDSINGEKSLVKNVFFCGYSITALYTVTSVLKIIRKTDEYSLPMNYPYVPKGFPYYHLTYIQQVFTMTYIGHCGTVADVFFSSLGNYISGHFEILGKRISKKGVDEKIVSYHKKILSLNDKLEEAYDQFLVIQIMLNIPLICFGLIQITQVKNVYWLHYIKCLLYVTLKTLQLFLYCYYGQKVIDKSSSVSNGVYFSPWYLHLKNKRLMHGIKLVLTRAQKPTRVRGGKIFVMCLPTLASAINKSYSFFTLLTSFRD